MDNYSENEQSVGFYGYDNDRKSYNSDASGDDSVKQSKKDGKRKDKESKKETKQAYATLEGESSPDELESKSPLKNKKTKSFKFPSSKSKPKREKSRDKDAKEKDKKEKSKDKPKSDRKDKKKNEDIWEEYPIFGVSLELATERSRCHDGVNLPLPVRECIDHIELNGLSTENLYKINSVKSKVQQVKNLYNNRAAVNWNELELSVATGLLKLFIRELPSPILTNELLPRFEDTTSVTSQKFVSFVQGCINLLPACNRTMLAWLLLHLHNVAVNDRENKMNVTVLSNTMNSVLLISHKLLSLLISNAKLIFPEVILFRYVAPMTCTEISGLVEPNEIESELKKQESLIEQIHYDMNTGCVTKIREEQLWEVQRIITQLKRKLRMVQKDSMTQGDNVSENTESSCEANSIKYRKQSVTNKSEEIALKKEPSIEASSQKEDHPTDSANDESDSSIAKVANNETATNLAVNPPRSTPPNLDKPKSEQSNSQNSTNSSSANNRPLLSDDDKNIIILQFQNSGLIELQTSLLCQIKNEKSEVISLKEKLRLIEDVPGFCADSDIEDDESLEWEKVIDLLRKENQILQVRKNDLIRELMEEREKCVILQSQLMYEALSQDST